LAKTIYIRCIYGILGREITKHTVISIYTVLANPIYSDVTLPYPTCTVISYGTLMVLVLVYLWNTYGAR